jgi:hypothetical protein
MEAVICFRAATLRIGRKKAGSQARLSGMTSGRLNFSSAALLHPRQVA